MGQIALFLSLTLSACLIVLDVRRRKTVSAAVWLPTLQLMILGSRSVSAWLGGNWNAANAGRLGNDQETSPLDQLFFFGVIAGSMMVLHLRRFRWGRLVQLNTALALFYGFFLLSLIWSGDPTGSLKRWIKDVGTILSVSVILTEKDLIQAIRAVYLRTAFVLLPLSVVFIRWIPAFGRSYAINGTVMYTGVTTQKNTLGELVLVLGLVLLWDCVEGRKLTVKQGRPPMPWGRIALLLLGLWLLNISQSKTALMCLIIGGVLLIRPKRLVSRSVNRAVLACILFVPVMVLSSQQFSSVLAPITEALGRNMTFTGRTDIWQHITLTTVNPIIGCGFYNFWGGPGGKAVSESMGIGGWGVPNAHCGYVDMFLDGGAIGIALLFSLLVALGTRLNKVSPLKGFDLLRFYVSGRDDPV